MNKLPNLIKDIEWKGNNQTDYIGCGVKASRTERAEEEEKGFQLWNEEKTRKRGWYRAQSSFNSHFDVVVWLVRSANPYAIPECWTIVKLSL